MAGFGGVGVIVTADVDAAGVGQGDGGIQGTQGNPKRQLTVTDSRDESREVAGWSQLDGSVIWKKKGTRGLRYKLNCSKMM